jgi:hypothetical protein
MSEQSRVRSSGRRSFDWSGRQSPELPSSLATCVRTVIDETASRGSAGNQRRASAREERVMKDDERREVVKTSDGAGWFLLIIGGLFVLAIVVGLLTG